MLPAACGRVRRSALRAAPYALLVAIAIVVRLWPLVIGGGLESTGRYDDGVYYAASDALTFGRVPYRDFVLLHPPGILLVLAPFALLGRLTSDPVGMAAGRLAFMGIGALNAVLVAVLARRWGTWSAVAAGVLYACWLPAVYSEQSTLLEPLGGTALLVALLLLVKTAKPPTARAEVAAGVVLGLACAMKIWYVAPWLVVVVCLLVARRRRAAVRNVISGAAALVVVLLPFFILAPRRMYDMVVRDQLLRPAQLSPRAHRLTSILGMRPFLPHADHDVAVVTTGIAVALLAFAALGCSRDPAARIIVAVLAGNMFVLLASPSYFSHYAALTAAPAALVFGIGLGKLVGAGRRRWPRSAMIWSTVFGVAVAGFAFSGVRIATTPEGNVFPRGVFDRADPSGCVTSDDPTALVEMNRLSSDFRAGCRVAVDVTGITYDTLHDAEPDGQSVPRDQNIAFQHYLYDYLLSGRAFVIARPVRDDLAPAFARAEARRPALALADGLVLRQGAGPGAGRQASGAARLVIRRGRSDRGS